MILFPLLFILWLTLPLMPPMRSERACSEPESRTAEAPHPAQTELGSVPPQEGRSLPALP